MLKVRYISIILDSKAPRFFIHDSDLIKLIHREYIDTGKMISMFETISDNDRRKEEIFIFKSEKDYEDFKNNEIIAYIYKVRLLYNIHYHIDHAVKIEEI